MRPPTKPLRTVVLIVAATLFVACLPSENPLASQALNGERPAGFLLGLWHGAIVWISFVVSLFDPSVSVYEVHNSGWPYNLGFVLGAATFHGGGGAASRRQRRREVETA